MPLLTSSGHTQLRAQAYEPGGWGAAAIIFRAKAISQKWKIIFFVFMSSEIKCPKPEIFTNSYWVGQVGQSNFAS